MVSVQKIARVAFAAGFAVALATGSATAQNAKIGSGATVNLEGRVGTQVAAALGPRSTAHNTVGGITAGGGLSIGNGATVTTRGRADWQWATAAGPLSSASNNVGGVLVTGGLTSR